MKSNGLIISIIILMVAVACTGTNGISAVTPLDTEATAASSTTPIISPTEVASEESTIKATLDLEATIAAANEVTNSNESSTDLIVTFTPSANRLGPGEARAIALATDTAMSPEIEEVMTFDESPVPLRFAEFYRGYDLQKGLLFSDKLKSLDGQRVIIEGYIAPPLRTRPDFFVLTREQLAYCPFCSRDVEWPNDMVLIYLSEPEAFIRKYPVRVTGILGLGSSVDTETGMVSLVRIYMQHIEVLRS